MITLTAQGIEHLLVTTFLQGVKDGDISSEYSGSTRRNDSIIPLADFYVMVDAFLRLSSDPQFAGDFQMSEPTATPTQSDVEGATSLLLLGDYASIVVLLGVTHVRLFEGLNQLGFQYSTSSNISGPCFAYGSEGLVGIYTESDGSPTPLDDATAYLAQFPRRGITGNDIALLLPAGQALLRMTQDTPWNPRGYAAYVSAFRLNYVPVPTP